MKICKLKGTVWCCFFIALVLFSGNCMADAEPTGTIEGRVVEAESQTPLPGTNVLVLGTPLGAATDADGRFRIARVPVGNWVLRFDYIGYGSLSKPDIIVRPQRITSVRVELQSAILDGETVRVRAGYFPADAGEQLSAVRFSAEEVRRAPGSAGDVSRIMMSLPGVAKINDQSNSLIVRGGSPIENVFFLDHIEISNINHFPVQGSSGGPIGILNVDFIDGVRFHTGGFSALWGDKLSSVMELYLREGNRSEFDGQVDLNFAGFGGVIEGPWANGKGSLLLSLRRSYLDWLVQIIDMGTSIAPRYGDAQGKAVFDLHPNHQLAALFVVSDEHNSPDRRTALENDMVYYGVQNNLRYTAGVNWRALWTRKAFSQTSLSFSSNRFNEDFYTASTTSPISRNRTVERSAQLRQTTHLRLHDHFSLDLGFDVKAIADDCDQTLFDSIDILGQPVAALSFSPAIRESKLGVFLNSSWRFADAWTLEFGVRTDHFSTTKRTLLAPRGALNWQVGPRTSLSLAAGIYHQTLPGILLYQSQAFRLLRDPRSRHLVVGITHLLTESTQLTVEGYDKQYDRFPLDPTQPGLFVIDEIVYDYGFFLSHHQLLDSGRADACGIEIMVQKKLARNIYGLAGASISRSRYRGLDGMWRPRVFDNRFNFSVEGGYKPGNCWEFSARWIMAGGSPYTPFDLQASAARQRAVLDEQRINQARYPDYHSLNVRADRRFPFKSSNLVIYLSIWNVYQRKNVAGYFWNPNQNRIEPLYQWSMMPIFGLEYEF